MRVVDRATFLSLPAGTVFAKYTPHSWDDLQIKEATVGEDFLVTHLTGFFEGVENDEQHLDVLLRMDAGGESPPIDVENCGRDGFFDLDQRFAVLSPNDVQHVISMLQTALGASGGR